MVLNNTKLGASFPVLILLRYYKNMVYEDYLFVLSLTPYQHFFSFVVVSSITCRDQLLICLLGFITTRMRRAHPTYRLRSA